MPVEIPPAFLGYATRSDEFRAWLGTLPRLLRDLLDEWQLGVDGLDLANDSGGCTCLVITRAILPLVNTRQ